MVTELPDGGTRADAGSFRDREGRVFHHHGEVYRALSASALADWRELQTKRFFAQAVEAGQIVATQDAGSDVPAPRSPNQEDWAGILHHEKIPVVSYPNEWSFSMLRAAALLHLDLMIPALDEGFVIKDSSAFNVQWRGTKPVFIDVPSFQKAVVGEPWIGYLQFCEHFLYPLMITAYKDVPFHTWLRGSLEGIPAADMNSLFSFWERRKSGVFSHVYLQAKIAGATAAKPRAIRDEVKEIGFSTELIKNNAKRMRRLVESMEWRRSSSEWSDYSTGHNYEPEEHEKKERFVAEKAASKQWTQLWDLGCNTGRFTRVAAEHAEYTVALDIDPLVIEKAYRSLASEDNETILPLVHDLVDPTPSRGWRSSERTTLATRGAPDLLLALALIHHIVIGRNVPMEEAIAWLAEFGAHLVIEFPTREDSMVERLLLNRDVHVHDYSIEVFERCLDEHFEVLDRLELGSGARVLYFARPKI